MTDVTRILSAIEQGDAATDELLPLVYEELRLLAAQKLAREAPGHTLQATALVHEAYLRLVGDDTPSWDSRGHFFVSAAEAMRRILIDNARRKQRQKRGDAYQRVDFEEADVASEIPSEDILALDEALAKLTEEDETKATLVKLRCFAGLTLNQAADALGISRSSVSRYWSYARAWLYHEINRES
jgi:RNA polymerase sigma factor (TIGR02999 family)